MWVRPMAVFQDHPTNIAELLHLSSAALLVLLPTPTRARIVTANPFAEVVESEFKEHSEPSQVAIALDNLLSLV
jgi:hypothetical protein